MLLRVKYHKGGTGMRISKDFIIKKIMDDYIVVPTGKEMVDFNAMITLNETGAFLWERLQEEKTENGLVEELCAEYDVSSDVAAQDIADFLKLLRDADILLS